MGLHNSPKSHELQVHQNAPELPDLRMLHTAPEPHELINRVAVKIPNSWREVAIGLGLDNSDISSIEEEMPSKSSTLCYVAVFDAWKHKETTEYTWGALIKTLRRIHFDDLAVDLERKIQAEAF